MTITPEIGPVPIGRVIQYRKMAGDYNSTFILYFSPSVIQYRKMTGDYNLRTSMLKSRKVIRYRKMTGDYNITRP